MKEKWRGRRDRDEGKKSIGDGEERGEGEKEAGQEIGDLMSWRRLHRGDNKGGRGVLI